MDDRDERLMASTRRHCGWHLDALAPKPGKICGLDQPSRKLACRANENTGVETIGELDDAIGVCRFSSVFGLLETQKDDVGAGADAVQDLGDAEVVGFDENLCVGADAGLWEQLGEPVDLQLSFLLVAGNRADGDSRVPPLGVES